MSVEENKDQQVLVTGVSGRAAGAMAERMQAAGYGVRALVRTPEQAAMAKLNAWVPVHGDLTDPPSLEQAAAGASVVVHAAAYSGPDWALAQTVNVDGARALARASLQAGVGRFVHISTMSVHGEMQPDGLDEESPMRPDEPSPYCATKARAELALREVSARGLTMTILRPGAIGSPTSSAWGDELVSQMRENGWPAFLHPEDVIPWVHTEDLAEMAWLAATHPAAAGETFIAVDRNVAIGDLHGPIAAALSQPVMPPDRVPEISRCKIGKIRQYLGYMPRHTFEHTVAILVGMAQAFGVGTAG
jgi:nucleoside-diphosphate-sugar epimerase